MTELSVEEEMAAEATSLHRAAGRALFGLGLLGLIISTSLLLSGRSLAFRSLGYLLVAVVAPTAVAFGARLLAQADPRPRIQGRRVRWVMLFNLACIVVGVLHALYVARRLI